MGAQCHGEYLNNVWNHVGIFVSGLMKLRPENLYINSLLEAHKTSLSFIYLFIILIAAPNCIH